MEKKRYGRFKSRSSKILKIMKNEEFWTATKIYHKLRETEEITLPGVIKILTKLRREGYISYYDFSYKGKAPKRMKREVLDSAGGKFNPKASKYYVYLPLRLVFRKRLEKILGELYNKRKYKKRVWEITRLFGGLELLSKRAEKKLDDPEKFKREFRRLLIEDGKDIKGKRLPKGLIEFGIEGIKNSLKTVKKFEINEAIEIVLSIKCKKINNEKYLLVGDDYVQFKKLERFIRLLPFTNVMILTIYAMELSKGKYNESFLGWIETLEKLIYKMESLFREIVKDSQIKV